MIPPRGMNDILPGDARRWQQLEHVFRRTVEAYGYEELRTPVHCHGSGVVTVEVYVPVELLRAGGNPVPRERKLCRCVGAEAREQSATQLEGR